MSDPERIWLQNANDARATGDRLWCQDKVWPECDEQQEPTEYIRADLYASRISQQDAELERVRREVEEAKEFRAILEGHLSAAIDDYNEALAALKWMADRDDRNGSLPEAYRKKIDETLAALRSEAEETGRG